MSGIDARLEVRFVDLRVDEADSNIVAGTLVRYGALADIGGYFREKINPGAFGQLGDVIANVQHDRATPLARTNGGGLELSDSPQELASDGLPYPLPRQAGIRSP